MSIQFCRTCSEYIDTDKDAEHFDTPQQCCQMCEGTGKVEFDEYDNHIEATCECTLEQK